MRRYQVITWCVVKRREKTSFVVAHTHTHTLTHARARAHTIRDDNVNRVPAMGKTISMLEKIQSLGFVSDTTACSTPSGVAAVESSEADFSTESRRLPRRRLLQKSGSQNFLAEVRTTHTLQAYEKKPCNLFFQNANGVGRGGRSLLTTGKFRSLQLWCGFRCVSKVIIKRIIIQVI